MAKQNKVVNVLSKTALAGMVASAMLTSQAFAAVDAYTVKVGDDVFKYDKAELVASFLDNSEGLDAPLYEDFTAKVSQGKGVYAFHDDKNGYVDFASVSNAFLNAEEGTFNLNAFTESKEAEVVTVPTVKKVTVVDGQIKEETEGEVVETGDLKVESVSAINSTALEVKGTALSKLKAEDIKVEGNTVKSVSASEDGKTATIALEDALIVGETTKVTALEKEYNVTYTVAATGVAIAEGQTYDDDTQDQFVKILVDGKAVTAQELINAGYNVTFDAYTTKAATTPATIFDGGVASSTTGELDAPITLGGSISLDRYVRVTVSNGSDVMTSSITKITIKNTNISADTITEAVLSNITTGADQTSSILVTNETANFSEITVKSANTTEVITAGNFTVKSSDESVVSVNSGTLTAEGPGTATLTITYGGTTYTKTITVKNEARKATSVKVNKTAVTVTENGTAVVKVQLLDQYGDPMDFTANSDLNVVSSDNAIATADGLLGNGTGSLVDPTGAKLEADLTIDGVDTGSAIFTFRNGAGAKIGTTSVKATVTDNTAVSQYTLAVDNDITSGDVTTLDGVITGLGFASITKNDVSTDATIDNGSDAYVKINIKGLNSAGQEILSTPVATTNYTVTAVNPSNVNVLDTTFGTNGVLAQNGYILVKAGTDAGTATITVTDASNANVTKTFKVTTTNVGYTVTGVNFKNVAAPTYATTLDVKDFLSYTNSANDLIITGLTLSKPVSQAIRLDSGDGTTLYIDKDGNGTNNPGDIEVGSIVISTTGTFANIATDAASGLSVLTGDDGTVIFKVLNTGSDKVVSADDQVVATKAVKVDF